MAVNLEAITPGNTTTVTLSPANQAELIRFHRGVNRVLIQPKVNAIQFALDGTDGTTLGAEAHDLAAGIPIELPTVKTRDTNGRNVLYLQTAVNGTVVVITVFGELQGASW